MTGKGRELVDMMERRNLLTCRKPNGREQVGCEQEDKEEFWGEVEELVQNIASEEGVVLGVDLNGHVGDGKRGDEGVAEEGGAQDHLEDRKKNSQMDYILCRRRSLKEFSRCKVVPGESATSQNRVLIGEMSLEVKAMKVRADLRIKW
ncbi:uncharacterized protein [Penaeus vannamei]|uniref:uncharacterized protein n=1 Tax=Penaeus vannamei TaxID=6689 RepID=UPI00387F8FC7